jgi:ubiquinone/menaquinone biosynthesis C-methylase UbiE
MQRQAADENLKDYYARRAREYERIYDKPERQEDLARLREIVPSLLDGRDVLEIACGTGYWTQHVAARAESMLATDINDEVLELARSKPFPRDNVEFARIDISRKTISRGASTRASAHSGGPTCRAMASDASSSVSTAA